MLSPTSMSAISIDTISKAVWAVELAGEHGLGNAVGIFEHDFVAFRRSRWR